MALTRQSAAQKFRKALAAVGVVVLSTARESVITAPLITSGTGAPTAADPNGSLYLRTDGSDGDDSLYMRIAGAWVALQCETT